MPSAPSLGRASATRGGDGKLVPLSSGGGSGAILFRNSSQDRPPPEVEPAVGGDEYEPTGNRGGDVNERVRRVLAVGSDVGAAGATAAPGGTAVGQG
jgi:hypothetical protein